MPNPIDISGQRFGMLVAMEVSRINGKRAWLCKCDCGNTRIVPTGQLRHGNNISCGCFIKPDLTGKVFSRLTVLGFATPRRGRTYYKVQCDCGRTSEVELSKLKNGHTKSCGRHYHIKPKARIPNHGAAYNKVIGSYRKHAEKRKLPFDLSRQEMIDLMINNCHYCGEPPSLPLKSNQGEVYYNGIDRMDNDKGYIRGNVVSCCKTCNYKKGATNYQDFITWVKRIASRF